MCVCGLLIHTMLGLNNLVLFLLDSNLLCWNQIQIGNFHYDKYLLTSDATELEIDELS